MGRRVPNLLNYCRQQPNYRGIVAQGKEDKKQYVKRSTFSVYRLLIENHILPSFSEMILVEEQTVFQSLRLYKHNARAALFSGEFETFKRRKVMRGKENEFDRNIFILKVKTTFVMPRDAYRGGRGVKATTVLRLGKPVVGVVLRPRFFIVCLVGSCAGRTDVRFLHSSTSRQYVTASVPIYRFFRSGGNPARRLRTERPACNRCRTGFCPVMFRQHPAFPAAGVLFS